MFRAARAVLVAVATAALAQAAASQDLSGLWFKVKVKSSGYSIAAGGQEVKKAKVSADAYVLFVAPPVDGGDGGLATTLYEWQVWCETTPGSWTLTESGAAYVEESDGTHFFLTDFDLEWFNDGGQAIEGHATDVIKVKRDSQGAITGATWKTLGGQAIAGTTDGTDTLRGSQARSGKLVKPEQLLFNPGA